MSAPATTPPNRTDPALERLAAAVETVVRQRCTPPRLQSQPLALAHRDALLELWRGFTAERPTLRRGYLQSAPARAAYLLYYTPTTAATVAATLDLAAIAWRLPTEGGPLPLGASAAPLVRGPEARPPQAPPRQSPLPQSGDPPAATPPVLRPLRLLDLGAGSLGASLGVALWMARNGQADRALEVVAVDGARAALEAGREALLAFAPKASVQLHTADLRDLRVLAQLGLLSAKPSERFDLVLVANVVNELPGARANVGPDGDEEDPAAAVAGTLERLLGQTLRHSLRPGGALLVVEPATRAASRAVIGLRDALVGGGLAVPLGPCAHARPCPLHSVKDWCFFSLPWQRPALVAACDQATGHDRSRLEASWLLLAPGPAIAAGAANDPPAEPGPKWDRLIGGPMRHEGVLRRYLCRRDGRRAVALAPLHAVPAWLDAAPRGAALTQTAGLPAVSTPDREWVVEIGRAPAPAPSQGRAPADPGRRPPPTRGGRERPPGRRR